MLKSVLNYLEQSELNYPDKTAVVDIDGSDTYAELADKARRVGSFLLEKGSHFNDVVVVLLEKKRSALSAFWGISYAGAIYAPIDCHAPLTRLKLIVEELHPACILTDEGNREKALQLMASARVFLLTEAYAAESDKQKLVEIQRHRIDTDPLYIICTSGSTGIPKGVVISHRSVIDFTEEASETMQFSDKEVFANQAPFYFDASVPDLYCTIRNGATLHIIPEKWFSFPIQVLEYIKVNGVNAIFWVPSALTVIANMRVLHEVDVSCLKKIMFCGEVMPVKQYNMWKRHVPDAKYVNYYGPSEATYASTYYVIDRDFQDDEALPIGRAAMNTAVLILNEVNEPCVPGEAGELCIRGSGVSLGYYNNPKKTEEVFVQNPLTPFYRDIIYRTGDIVKENDKGEIEYVGRMDFQIKHMGYRIELGEIETAVSSLDGISRCCCLYDTRKSKIIMFIESETEISRKTVNAYLADKIPEYMLPGKVVNVPVMPVNANGKIDRKALKEML